MSILSRLTGSAQKTAARSTRTSGRSTSSTSKGKGMGGPRRARATTGRGAPTGGGFQGFGRRSTAGRGRSAPATSNSGLAKLIGSLTGRR